MNELVNCKCETLGLRRTFYKVKATWASHDHFLYSHQYPEKQELIIEIRGYAAKIIGYLLRAEQY